MAIVSHHSDPATHEVYSIHIWDCEVCKRKESGPRNYSGPPPEGWLRYQDDYLRKISHEIGYEFFKYVCPQCGGQKAKGITEVPHFHIPGTDQQ